MATGTVDITVELLSGGLSKLAAMSAITGTLKANAEGVALVVQVVTSLFSPPPSIATHISLDGVAPADLLTSGIQGGSADPSGIDGAASAVSTGGGAEEDSDGGAELSAAGSESGAADDDMGRAYAAPGAVASVASSLPPAPLVGEAVVVETEDGGFSTLLGRALGDEGIATRLAAAWAAYPRELHQALADDLYTRLDDNMGGASEQLEAAMGFLCVLYREPGRSFDADGFWAAAAKFARAERALSQGALPVWLRPLLTTLVEAVVDRAGQAPGQGVGETRRIVAAAVPPGLKGRRPEFTAIEAVIRSAYPAGATIVHRARMVAATWCARQVEQVAHHVIPRAAADPTAREAASYPDVAAAFDLTAGALARCLSLVSEGTEAEIVATVAVVVDPTRAWRLVPDATYMGWGHPMRRANESSGVAWKGANMVAREIASSAYALPEVLDEGTVRSTCNVSAHGAKDQGEGTLCRGCQLGKGCTERFDYAKGGVAILQGHVGACETQVLAQLKSTFPGGTFVASHCTGLLSGEHAVPCSLTPKSGGAAVIEDPAEWAAAMRKCLGPFKVTTARGDRKADYPVARTVAMMRAIPVAAVGWAREGGTLPAHPQDEHSLYFFFRFEPAGPHAVPIQAVFMRGELPKHPSWGLKWFKTAEGKAYRDKTRDEQREELLAFVAARAPTAGGSRSKKRSRSASGAVGSGSDHESVPDEFAGFSLAVAEERVVEKQIGLVAAGTTLSCRRLEADGATGVAGGCVDQTRSLSVLIQEGMHDAPLLVWAFPFSLYAKPSFGPQTKSRVLMQTPFDRLDLTQGVTSAEVGGYQARGDIVVEGLLNWLRPFAGSRPGTDMADLVFFFRSYSEPSDRCVAGRMYPTQVASRHCWHNTPHPAGTGGPLPPELDAAIRARVKDLPQAAGSMDEWVVYLHRRMAVMFGMPPERWAYTLLHLAEYNGGRLPGLVEPGLVTRDAKDGFRGRYAHEHAVVQEVILHAMYWVMSGAPIEVCPALDADAWRPPEGESEEVERQGRFTIVAGNRLEDRSELARLLLSGEAAPDGGAGEEAGPSMPARVALTLEKFDVSAQASWADFVGSGALLTMGMATLCFVHLLIEVRIAGVTQDAHRPSTKFAGSCPALQVEGESEVHTFVYDVALTYTCTREVGPAARVSRARLQPLSEAFGLVDADGADDPAPSQEEVFNRVRLTAAVPYLEAAEGALRERLDELVGSVAGGGVVAHDQYSFHRPQSRWRVFPLPEQYECEKARRRNQQKTVRGMSRCLLCTISTGAGSPDPRGAHRMLAMIVAALDLAGTADRGAGGGSSVGLGDRWRALLGRAARDPGGPRVSRRSILVFGPGDLGAGGGHALPH